MSDITCRKTELSQRLLLLCKLPNILVVLCIQFHLQFIARSEQLCDLGQLEYQIEAKTAQHDNFLLPGIVPVLQYTQRRASLSFPPDGPPPLVYSWKGKYWMYSELQYSEICTLLSLTNHRSQIGFGGEIEMQLTMVYS